jgi:hypothetical protein
LSNCISRLHSSTELTSCRSAIRASELNVGRELRPKPVEVKNLCTRLHERSSDTCSVYHFQ